MVKESSTTAEVDSAPQSIVPTEYRGYSEVYAGLVHEMLPEGRIISIIERPMMSTTDDSSTHVMFGKSSC